MNSTKIDDIKAGIVFVICCLLQNNSFLAHNKPIVIHKVYMFSEINDDFSHIHIYIYVRSVSYIYVFICICIYIYIYVKQSRYRPGVAQRLPGS